MDVSIIIVNYNTANILPVCLDSVLQQIGVSYQMIVVDNASQDNSQEVLKTYAARAILLLNKDNLGFGRANNQAFHHCQGRYIYLLNPDANLQSPTALQELVAFMDKNPSYGIAGTRIIKAKGGETKPLYNYPGQKYNPSIFSQLPGEIAWVLGASMIIRREAYALVNGFDEDYFLYGEETDLCLRVRKQGYAIGYCGDVEVSHIGGASEQRTPTQQLWDKKYRGLYLFYRKHYSPQVVSRLVKRHFLKSSLRLFILNIQKLIFPLKGNSLAKYYRYKSLQEISREFLTK